MYVRLIYFIIVMTNVVRSSFSLACVWSPSVSLDWWLTCNSFQQEWTHREWVRCKGHWAPACCLALSWETRCLPSCPFAWVNLIIWCLELVLASWRAGPCSLHICNARFLPSDTIMNCSTCHVLGTGEHVQITYNVEPRTRTKKFSNLLHV